MDEQIGKEAPLPHHQAQAHKLENVETDTCPEADRRVNKTTREWESTALEEAGHIFFHLTI